MPATGDFDFMLSQGNQQLPGFGNTQNQQSPYQLPPGPGINSGSGAPAGGRFDFLKDPNIIQAMATAGSAISAGENAASALGNAFGGELIRKKALQREVGANLAEKKGLQQSILDQIREDPFGEKNLGGADDASTANGWSIKDGKISVDINNPGKTNVYPNLNSLSAESQTNEPDLPDF